MMLHFFASLDGDDATQHVASLLATDNLFLRADPDAPEQPTEMFRSAFLTNLISTTHLDAVAPCVDVPGWDVRAMAAGKGGEGVVAIASAAVRPSSSPLFFFFVLTNKFNQLERALTFFCDGTLDVDRVLAEMAPRPHPVPRTVRDTLPSALRFSAANWSGRTAAYRAAVRTHGEAFVCGTFAAAQRRKGAAAHASAETVSGAGASVPCQGYCPDPDPRSLL